MKPGAAEAKGRPALTEWKGEDVSRGGLPEW